jgi:hypothetical protein
VGDEVEDVQTHQQIIIDHHHIRVIRRVSFLSTSEVYFTSGGDIHLYLHLWPRTYDDTVYVDISDTLRSLVIQAVDTVSNP